MHRTPGDATFHNVSFTFDVTTDNTAFEFGIKKLTDGSKIDWCQIKNVTLTLNSTNVIPVANNSVADFTYTATEENTWHTNTWSPEGQSDGSRFQVPFHELWRDAKDNAGLNNATITATYTPTESGVYKVSAWVRVVNQNGGDINGVRIFVGDTKTDACSGSPVISGKGRLGTYTAMADGESGTPFNYGFEIEGSNANWLAFKNVVVTYLGDLPQKEIDALLAQVPTGKMNADVQAELDSKVNDLNTDKSVAAYNALASYIPTANASVIVYENIATIRSTYADKAANLDAAGRAAYKTATETATTGAETMYSAGTYTTAAEAEEAFHNDYVAAVKSQNTAGADMTDAMLTGNSGWTCTQGNGPNSYSVATETYVSSGGGFTKGDGDYKKIMYQSIDGLPAGLYMVEFYGISNSANNVSTVEGSGIVQAYANDADLDITVIKQKSCTPTDYPRTLYCSVGVDGTLEYGLKSIANGSNWAVCKIKALTYLGNTSALMAVNSTAKWGTFCAPFDVAIPGGVNAYKCSAVENGVLTLTPVETTISANTPVILNAGSGLESTTFYGVREGSDDIVTYGLLKGNVSTTVQDVPSGAYLLQRNNGKTGFYMANGDGYKIGYNRCYLVESGEFTAREAFFLEGEGETAINEIETVETKAEGLKDGKYLINGRIVIVKDGKTLSVSGQILK